MKNSRNQLVMLYPIKLKCFLFNLIAVFGKKTVA